MISVIKMQKMGFELNVDTEDWNFMNKSNVVLTVTKEELSKFKSVPELLLHLFLSREWIGFNNGRTQLQYEFRKLMGLGKK